MDLLCPKCSEPWDNDEFHDVAEEKGSTYLRVWEDFQRRGCEAVGSSHGGGPADPRVAALYEVLGHDPDGCAAMFDDMPSYEEEYGYGT